MKSKKKVISAIVAVTVLVNTYSTVFAADNDGWTEASQTAVAKDGSWNKWCETWDIVKNNPIQISLTPGKNETELNFSWYSKDSETNPKLRFGKKQDLSDAKEIFVTTKNAVNGFKSNQCTVTGLEENTIYYYSYQVNGLWSEATQYRTKGLKSFSFIFVGDPQIGSSYGNIASGATSEQGQDNATRNDSFNWNNTLNTAIKANPNISFMVSAGDQIQSRDKKNPSQTYDKNEIEYSGYLSATALKSLPVATTIGNHDAPSGNYSFHFNNPNTSNLGRTEAGGDYYYCYGNALFIVLNTNNYNIAEHKQLIEKAVTENKDAKWRILTMHQDIYGSGEHSNEPEIVNLRYNLIPIFEKNNIDVVLTGHDHTYSRSFLLKGGEKDEAKFISEEAYDNYIDAKTPIDSKYNSYLESIEDVKAVQDITFEAGKAINPKGILYLTANSASGSKYYDLVQHKQAYIASRWQEDVPTYSVIDINDDSFTINTFRTDNGDKIDNTFSITKTNNESDSSITVGNEDVKGQDKGETEQAISHTEAKVESKSDNVKTGDSFTAIPVVIAILSLFGLIIVNKKKRNGKNSI